MNFQSTLNWIKETPIAHRGLHNTTDKPENSFSAFDAALKNNLPIEIDLQITSDNKLIVFHDDNFLRMVGFDKQVNQVTSQEIRKFQLVNTSEKIPFFLEFLEYINGRVPILIEIKNFARPGKFEEIVIENLSNYQGQFALQSFNPLTVRWLKINKPEIPRGQISSKFREMPVPLHYKYMLRNLTLNFSAKPHFINYNIDDLPYLPVELYRNYGIPILAWTIKTESQLAKAKDLADNFVFEQIPLEKILG
ncbi:MAG: glycerophosphodiester phosphodiesterase family protein [Melioribacteraceae bacterium]|nr:glycerophosphodiester phosphodiesterase family protein [Melioribacteraceae bacterium]